MNMFSKEKFVIMHSTGENAEAIVRPNITYWQDAWRRLKKNKLGMLSLIILGLIIILCIFGPHISKFTYDQQLPDFTNQNPVGGHFFGTDNLGRDLFVRCCMGGRVSILIGLIATLVEVIVGSIYGGICGFFGGFVDDVMMRIVEVINGIPYMIIVILVSIVLGSGLFALIIALCITAWTGIARIVRGQVLQIKQSEYIMAAEALGASPMRIILKHLLPNTLGIMIIYMTFDIPGFIFGEAFLSFIGLGIQPPSTSWGSLCSAGQQQMSFYPYQLFFPAVIISITMLAFNLLGDALRDALDPKLRQ